MSVLVKDFLNNSKLPRFIVENGVLNSFTKIDKAFPRLGLPNFRETCSVDNSNLARKAAWDLLYQLSCIFTRQRSFLDQKVSDASYSEEKQDRISDWYLILGAIKYQIDLGYNNLIHSSNGKVVLKLPVDINADFKKDESLFRDFKKDESLFRVYNKVYDGIRALRIGSRIPKLDTIQAFKDFSAENIPTRNFDVVFSSDGLDGLWDITTMSMRGIKSCQSWTSSSKYKTNIIGSIVDPFVGVIYLTSGKDTPLGSKMIKRCVVRMIVDTNTRKPSIIIDQMYPDFDEKIAVLFRDILRRRLDNKIDVLLGPNIRYERLQSLYIPHSKAHDKLTKTTKSYMDTKMAIGHEKRSLIINKQKAVKVLLQQSAMEAWNARQKPDPTTISKSPAIQASIGKIVDSPDFRYLLTEYITNVCDDIAANTPNDPSMLPNDYKKRLCYQFLTHKPNKLLLTRFVRAVNSYYSLPKGSRINSAIMTALLTSLSIRNTLSKAVKAHLRTALDTSSDSANAVSTQ